MLYPGRGCQFSRLPILPHKSSQGIFRSIITWVVEGQVRLPELLRAKTGHWPYLTWDQDPLPTWPKRSRPPASVVSVEGTGWNPWRTIIFMWNCYNLEETNSIRRLRRHGPNRSRSRIKTKGPSRDGNQVREGKTLFTARQMESAVGFPSAKSWSRLIWP